MKTKPSAQQSKTTVGVVADAVLAYTAGRDVELDHALIGADCLGSAAHAVMLSRMRVTPPIFSRSELREVIASLAGIVQDAAAGRFRITVADQDVHLAVERALTKRIGDLGRRIHTGRSRNDQVALDLRLYSRDQVLDLMDRTLNVMQELLRFAKTNRTVPMVGRTHLQPAMPSSVALWATAYVEDLGECLDSLRHVYRMNNRCPLGAAAGYGVPLPIDRLLTARLLGFDAPIHNVLYAMHTRGKNEGRLLHVCAEMMTSLSRLSQDMILFSMPEFGYFRLPPELGTGSSIMPQKNNPDVLELVRARAARLQADAGGVMGLMRALPAGYHRDLQETKEPLMNGFETTLATLKMMSTLIRHLSVDRSRLRGAFSPPVFATDYALTLVRQGLPFREAYRQVKEHPEQIPAGNPDAAVTQKTHWGAPGGLDFDQYRTSIQEHRRWINSTRRRLRQLADVLLPGCRDPLTHGGAPLKRKGKR